MSDPNDARQGDAAEFFGTQADRWVGLYSAKASFIDRLQIFEEGLRRTVPPPARVLDFGCGPGIISLALASRGYDVLGVDGSIGMVERAKVEAGRLGSKARFEAMDALSSSALPAEHFDAVVCSSVIEYVEDDEGLLRQLIRALRPGGLLLVSVPHRGSLMGLAEDGVRMIASYTSAQRRRHLKFSLRRYAHRPFAERLHSLGLSVERTIFFECPVPGRPGVIISRLPLLGTMMLAVARRTR